MTIARIDTALVGAWEPGLTFTEGRRRGERERLRWTFLPDGVIVGTDPERGVLPPAVGEWAAGGDRFSFWLNAVRNDGAGPPTTIVYGHARGRRAHARGERRKRGLRWQGRAARGESRRSARDPNHSRINPGREPMSGTGLMAVLSEGGEA
jgi:hypothetical protein